MKKTKAKKEKVDRSNMGFIVIKDGKKFHCITEKEVWEMINNDWKPTSVSYEDGTSADQFIPF